jgi:protein-tyrosine phosphatase
MQKVRVLMVCMGNICRSPTAEAVLRQKLRTLGVEDRIEVDSAGTHGWHAGAPPDARSQAHAALRGYDLSMLRARCLVAQDFDRHDHVLVMDDENLAHVAALCPPTRADCVRRLMAYATRHAAREVPDPYSGGVDGFERVLDLVEDACDGLARELVRGLQPEGNFGG